MSGPQSVSEALYLTAAQLRAESEAGIPMKPARLLELSVRLRNLAFMARSQETSRRGVPLHDIEAGPARGVVVDFPPARQWHSDAVHGDGGAAG
jgi:hypothetical protein